MQQRRHHGFLAGTLLGATVALAGVAGAHSDNDEAGNGGMMQGGKMEEGMMMQGGMMASMEKMMGQCSDMMARMQGQHGQQATKGDDAS